MSIRKINISGAIFTMIAGTFLHFAYDLSGGSDFVAIFSAINESTWEHLKLIFFPVVLFAIAEYFIYGKTTPNFLAAKTISLIVGMLSIVAIFFTYTGVWGESVGIINILLFLSATILTYYLAYSFIELQAFSEPLLNRISPFILIGIFIMFWVFTFYPPLINLFRDPISGGFGI